MQVLTLCLTIGKDRMAVVIGGGCVALRKTKTLLDAGLRVRLIAPSVHPELIEASAGPSSARLEIHTRVYRSGDLAGATLVFAATDDPYVNQEVLHEANRRGILVNVADDPQNSDFISPAVIQRGDLTVSVSTGGKSPALARWLRQRIECDLLPQVDELAGLLADARPLLAGKDIDIDRILEAGILDTLHEKNQEAALALLLEVVHER